MLPPPDTTKPNTPIAFVRSDGPVKSIAINEVAMTETTAPPSPCRTRAASSIHLVVATPQARLASVNAAVPYRNSRRCPRRSPRRPASNMKPANVSM
jgi:hypothetical protein